MLYALMYLHQLNWVLLDAAMCKVQLGRPGARHFLNTSNLRICNVLGYIYYALTVASHKHWPAKPSIVPRPPYRTHPPEIKNVKSGERVWELDPYVHVAALECVRNQLNLNWIFVETVDRCHSCLS